MCGCLEEPTVVEDESDDNSSPKSKRMKRDEEEIIEEEEESDNEEEQEEEEPVLPRKSAGQTEKNKKNSGRSISFLSHTIEPRISVFSRNANRNQY